MTTHLSPPGLDSHDEPHDDLGGLRRDLPRLVERRQALRWMGGLGLVGLLAACGAESSTTAPAATPTAAATGAAAAATPTAAASPSGTEAGEVSAASPGEEIPDETAGPYPADGSNGPNVLGTDGIVRTDIRSSVGGLTGTADGVPTTIQLTVVDATTGAALPGAAVYLWHCTADGRYSIYEVTDQNYLRGVAVADDAGHATFTSVFPGCYAGRWPHCHFEVYDDLSLADAGAQATKVSQLALPQAECEAVYADGRYGNSLSNLGRLSLSSDNVFRDGWESQLATVTTTAEGHTVSLLVRV